MFIILNVVIDIHFDLLDVGVLVSVLGQLTQYWFINGFEPGSPRAFALFKGLVVHLNQQRFDTGVQLG